MTRVAVCDYGAGNIRSVAIALERLGAQVTVTTDADTVAGADLAVLPGVGSAASAMAALRSAGIDEALRARARGPTLGICLGLQLALEHSEEDGGVDGPRPPARPRTPSPRGARAADRLGAGRPARDTFYFAHSFAADTSAATAWSEGYVAEARSGAFLGVQFHPEKSGAAGARYLERCLSPA